MMGWWAGGFPPWKYRFLRWTYSLKPIHWELWWIERGRILMFWRWIKRHEMFWRCHKHDLLRLFQSFFWFVQRKTVSLSEWVLWWCYGRNMCLINCSLSRIIGFWMAVINALVRWFWMFFGHWGTEYSYFFLHLFASRLICEWTLTESDIVL